MAVTRKRHLHVVEAGSVVVMLLAAVGRAFSLVGGMVIVGAIVVRVPAFRAAGIMRVGVLQRAGRTARTICGQAANQAQLDEQSEYDGAGETHAGAANQYLRRECAARALFREGYPRLAIPAWFVLLGDSMLRSVASARAGFTPADMAYLEALHGDSPAIRCLTEDAESLRELLDLPDLRRALLESPVALPVSPSLYFYVLVRHAFLDGGIDHADLADHVAGVLVDKLAGVSRAPGGLPHWATHAVDFLALIRNASGLLRMHLEVAAGDHFLVLTGLFPGFLAERENRSGAPGIGFYESFGRQSYHRAACHGGISPDTREIFGLLAEVFPLARRTLNRMREHCLFLGD